jgi:hypothetical protein
VVGVRGRDAEGIIGDVREVFEDADRRRLVLSDTGERVQCD